jgi:SAM-dependent methyltransferase
LSIIRRGLGRLSRGMMRLLPSPVMARLLGGLAVIYARALSPADGLRFLFDLDRRAYHAEGKLAILYGEGVHTKHRHTRYHDFFVGHVETGERVLDIGCGNGALACDLAGRAGAIVFGMDINPKNIHTAQTIHVHPNVTYQVGDVYHDLPDDTPFDVIVLSNVLEHLVDRPAFLHSLASRFTPSRFLIRVPCFQRDWRVPLQEELAVDYRLDPTHEVEYTQDGFREEMAEAGLAVESLEAIWGELWAVVYPERAGDE